MADGQGNAWTFDTVARDYEKFRPGYPDELYRTLFDYIPLGGASRAVEVGIGAGQATPPVLKTGCAVTAVEPGARFSELCREKFGGFAGFSVINGRFEDAGLPEGSFDLVYSASAFHWIPEEPGYKKVFRLLKSGGAFARFANHPYMAKDDPALFADVQRVYAEYYYPYYHKKPETPAEFTVEQAKRCAGIAEKYGFEDVRCAVFSRVRTFSSGEYRTLIGTYSNHRAIEEKTRELFFSKVEEAIDRHGGSIHVFDTIDLQLARKPRGAF